MQHVDIPFLEQNVFDASVAKAPKENPQKNDVRKILDR